MHKITMVDREGNAVTEFLPALGVMEERAAAQRFAALKGDGRWIFVCAFEWSGHRGCWVVRARAQEDVRTGGTGPVDRLQTTAEAPSGKYADPASYALQEWGDGDPRGMSNEELAALKKGE